MSHSKAPDQVRSEVSAAYSAAVKNAVAQVGSGACCAVPGCCSPHPAAAPGRVKLGASVTELAGYANEDLARLPEGATASAFGCGNPVGLAGLQPGDVVLDLGSGAGIDLLLAAERVGPTGRVIGVDMTDDMLAQARKNLEQAGATNVEVRKGIIEQLPVDDASVDWVISNCVINLSPDKPAVFREIARVLKPGGQILISDIVAEGLPEWILENAAMYAGCIAGAISETEYLKGLEAVGLTEVAVRDRLIYDASQLAAFVSDDLPETPAAGCGCGLTLDPAVVQQVSETVTGQIWSAKVYGRKP